MIDGRDIRDYQQLSLRQHMSVVTQEPFLFNDTIWNNIVYGKFDASEEDDGYCIAMISTVTNCAERGIRLSGGQRQRIVIARAFLKNPEILLLDECTASVEPESEAIIQETLDKLMRNRTTIIISHRLSMVRHADKILVLDKGVITEKGSYQELMELNGWFARMEMLQGKTGIERDSDSNKI